MSKLTTLDHIANLIGAYLRGELNADQQQELDRWIAASPANKAKFESLTREGALLEKFREWKQAGDNQEAGWQKIVEQMRLQQPDRKYFRINRLAVAAAVVLMVGLGSYWFMFRPKPADNNNGDIPVAKVMQQDVAPGSYKARLTLADGSTVLLDSVAMSQVLQQGNTAIVNKNGQLVYDNAKAGGSGKEGLQYNTLATASGETYSLTMSDGSRVWLNAASSIHYPVTFAGTDRTVTITGEVYFEVAHNPSKPFKVTVKGIQTEVLGTKFNINSYGDEAIIKTTLLEGKIKVTPDNTHTASRVLKPAQQACFNAAKATMEVLNNIDTEEVMAWKNGRFAFNDTSIEMVMRQLQRWYGVDIAFAFDTKKQPINVNGQISRFSNVSKVLEMLEGTGLLNFTMDGRKITVHVKK